MQRTTRIGTHELRALAGAMLGWIDNERLGVVAQGIDLPRIICRDDFMAALWWLDELKLARVVIGALMLDGFSESQRDYLKGVHRIGDENIRKEKA